jgi:hypothetical protein
MLKLVGKVLVGLAVIAVCFWVTLMLMDRLGGRHPAAATTTSAAIEPGASLRPNLKGWNEELYLAVNPDVAAAIARKEFVSARQHYESTGFAEGRKGASVPSDWNEAEYLKANPEVAAAVSEGRFMSGYHEYLVVGRAEGRGGGFP